jgi:hypothetical protein
LVIHKKFYHNQSCLLFRFEFVRAVGNTIVKPQIQSGQGWTGKVIKHQTGQGPLYIRATRDIAVAGADPANNLTVAFGKHSHS